MLAGRLRSAANGLSNDTAHYCVRIEHVLAHSNA